MEVDQAPDERKPLVRRASAGCISARRSPGRRPLEPAVGATTTTSGGSSDQGVSRNGSAVGEPSLSRRDALRECSQRDEWRQAAPATPPHSLGRGKPHM